MMSHHQKYFFGGRLLSGPGLSSGKLAFLVWRILFCFAITSTPRTRSTEKKILESSPLFIHNNHAVISAVSTTDAATPAMPAPTAPMKRSMCAGDKEIRAFMPH